MKHIPELLAPVGGLAQLYAAVNNGADAVYLGGARFNARAKADNFTLPKLRDAIGYAHERNVKVYVTFNTLLKDRELPDALDYAAALWEIGADAVIVQDMGLVRILGKYLPELPLHLSTQATVYNPQAVGLMKEFGIRRIVPARELSLMEIQRLVQACHGGPEGSPGRPEDSCGVNCEVEVFVHGALCMCYSGQCQMSRLLGAGGKTSRRHSKETETKGSGRRHGKETGTKESDNRHGKEAVTEGSARSGNRGLCAQPCRLPYTDDQGRTGYFLSPKDLCLLEELPALCEAGVDSLKIEGRLKSPEYVAVVTGIYRKYLDQYAGAGVVEVEAEDMAALTQIYSRGGFTTGYLYGDPGEKLLSGQSPKNTGVYIGKVRSVVSAKSAGGDKAAAAGAAKKDASLVDVMLQGELNEGDGVEIRPAGSREDRADESRKDRTAGDRKDRTAGGRKDRAGGMRGRIVSKARQEEGKDAGGVVTFRKELTGGAVRIGDIKGRIKAGDRVFRVTSRAQLERARHTFDAETTEDRDRQMRRHIPLEMEFTANAGEPALLRIRETAGEEFEHGAATNRADDPGRTAAAGPEVCISSQEPAEQAQNRPSDPERIRGQLAKLGGTPFEAAPGDIAVCLDGSCVVPVSEINRMRREGIRQLLQQKRAVRRTPADLEQLAKAEEELIGCTLQIPAAKEVLKRLGEPVPLEDFMAGKDGMPCMLEVTKGSSDEWIEENFGEIIRAVKERGIILNNTGWIRRFQDAGVKVYGGHGLNVYNEQARQAFEQIGVEIIEASYEADQPLDGKIPLMITEHPVKSKTLTDRKGQVHRVETAPSGDKTLIW